MFSFYPKDSRTGCRRKLPDPPLDNVFNRLSIDLRYIISFEWPNLDLKYDATVMLKGQPQKFKTSV